MYSRNHIYQLKLCCEVAPLKKRVDLLGPPGRTKVVEPKVSEIGCVWCHVESFGVLDALNDMVTLAVSDHAVLCPVYDEHRQRHRDARQLASYVSLCNGSCLCADDALWSSCTYRHGHTLLQHLPICLLGQPCVVILEFHHGCCSFFFPIRVRVCAGNTVERNKKKPCEKENTHMLSRASGLNSPRGSLVMVAARTALRMWICATSTPPCGFSLASGRVSKACRMCPPIDQPRM